MSPQSYTIMVIDTVYAKRQTLTLFWNTLPFVLAVKLESRADDPVQYVSLDVAGLPRRSPRAPIATIQYECKLSPSMWVRQLLRTIKMGVRQVHVGGPHKSLAQTEAW